MNRNKAVTLAPVHVAELTVDEVLETFNRTEGNFMIVEQTIIEGDKRVMKGVHAVNHDGMRVSIQKIEECNGSTRIGRTVIDRVPTELIGGVQKKYTRDIEIEDLFGQVEEL